MNEFAKVHRGIEELKNQITFLENSMKHEHLKTRLFPALETLRQAMRLASYGQLNSMVDYCKQNQCYHKLEQLTRHAPDLLDAYIKSIGPYQDYVTLVPAYAHRLISVVGNSAIVVELNVAKVSGEYIGLKEMSVKIKKLLGDAKWRWSQVKDNIKLDMMNIMRQGRHKTNEQVLDIMTAKLRPKFEWLSLGILVYNDIWGSNNHWIYGYYAHVFHESGKNAVVFYQNKGKKKIPMSQNEKSLCASKYMEYYCLPRLFAVSTRRNHPSIRSTASIKRYNGLWYNIPSDYSYCVYNNHCVTNLAIKG